MGRSSYLIPYIYQTIPYLTIAYHTTPYHTTPRHATPRHTTPHHTTPHHTTPHHTTLHHTIPNHIHLHTHSFIFSSRVYLYIYIKIFSVLLQIGLASSLPYVCSAVVSPTWGYFIDVLRSKKYISTITGRKLSSFIGKYINGCSDIRRFHILDILTCKL